MLPKTRKNPFQATGSSDPFQIADIIEVIENSDLSESKKLTHLFLIAEGSFSDTHLKKLREDLAEIVQEFEKKKVYQEKKLSAYDEKIATVEKEIVELTPPACEELKNNLDKLVAHAAKTKIKTKFSKS